MGEQRSLERGMILVRWLGVALGIVSILLTPHYPSLVTEGIAWGVVALVAAGNAVIASLLRRASSRSHLHRLNVGAFAFDSIVVMLPVWVYAYQRPYVLWGLLLIVPLDGALRFRLKGAIAGAAAVALFLIPQSAHLAYLRDTAFDFSTYVFIGGLAALVGGIAGVMAENWYTQRKAFESQSLELAEMDRLKDRFLAVTSHEIRGPLTAVITGVDTIRRRADRLSEEQKAHLLEMVSSQAHQLARLVDDLTLTSQLQSGQLSLQPEWVDMDTTIDRALDAAAGKRRHHLLHIFVEPLHCEIDASRLGQIVRNLVENAYKYTPDRAKVAVTARAVEGGIFLKVDDTGPGIPPEKRGQLFEAFTRIEETAAGREGVGLGLYVVSQLVSAMRGRIDLTSSSRGTSFEIFVPCAVRSQEQPRLDLIHGDA